MRCMILGEHLAGHPRLAVPPTANIILRPRDIDRIRVQVSAKAVVRPTMDQTPLAHKDRRSGPWQSAILGTVRHFRKFRDCFACPSQPAQFSPRMLPRARHPRRWTTKCAVPYPTNLSCPIFLLHLIWRTLHPPNSLPIDACICAAARLANWFRSESTRLGNRNRVCLASLPHRINRSAILPR
jgi:hypothetical protein